VRTPLIATLSIALVVSLLTSTPAAAAPAAPAQSARPSTAAATAVAAAPPTAPVTKRLEGADRYRTAIAVSSRYAAGVPAAFVATGADFPDALAAAPAAARAGGPVLLTARTALPAAVARELRRLAPQRIYVIGGTGVVGTQVQRELAKIAPVTRLAGANRFATAEAVVKAFYPAAPEVFMATGRGFADALAAGAAAGSRDWPVLIVDGAASSVPASTRALLRGLGTTRIHVAGGYGAVRDVVQAQLVAAGHVVSRYGGASRYETAATINDAFFDPAATPAAVLASGQDFPDALVGAALAGHRGAPLFVTLRDCVPNPVLASAAWEGVSSLEVLGGTGAVSDQAAALAPCAATPDAEPLPDWAVSGWSFDADVESPYSDRPPYDVADASLALDPTGLRIYISRHDVQRADHAVVYAQYGISALIEYERTGERLWLDRAARHAEQLIAMRVVRGDAWWFPYWWPWTYDGRRMNPPWWSAMAQGQALSLFVRLAQETGELRWDVAADRTWLSFTQSRAATGPWAPLVIDDHLYLEEFAGNQPPLLVLNGQIFSLFGLYDYWRHTGDTEVRRYLDGATTTVVDMMPKVRVPGDVSYYCVQEVFCQRPRWQDMKYHQIHSWQLDTLARITQDQQFADWADLLREDWSPTVAPL
jgi:putative cell wall-binding protein